ncbi:hypothetical protein Glove_124g22 [Diversispora epigaea]|uniref:WRKY domain-containing protein n=1 Tax=Diversispora epigaea TaxID=1348612 RepID=A0A397IYF0_9GLOM|nr:hypothetical protein Glove_124g22 [Diversispora epigaea]
MSTRETQYAYSYTTPKSHQQLHQTAQASLHHQYTQQQNQFTTTQDSLLSQATSGTNSQYTSPHNHSITPNNSGIQPRRFKTSQHTSISSQNSTTPNRQYTTSQHPPIAPPTLDHPNSPLNSTQCLSASNNVTTMTSTSLPNSLPTPPTIPAGLSSPSSGTTSVTNFELQDVIAQFQTQPELLKLILTSKVEEDKRRAEEAKLRVKELDLMLSERNRQRKNLEHEFNNNDMDYDNNDHSIGAPTTSQLQLTSQDLLTSSNNQIITSRSQLASHDQEGIRSIENEENNNNNTTSNKRKRKRREMLPVTVIIETKEFPYVDDYLWKNNGNTTQKKTGNKSVYFKCSNSNKGCPVNKTVTEKEGGWTIKYRGHHLEECGKIKRIVQN